MKFVKYIILFVVIAISGCSENNHDFTRTESAIFNDYNKKLASIVKKWKDRGILTGTRDSLFKEEYIISREYRYYGNNKSFYSFLESVKKEKSRITFFTPNFYDEYVMNKELVKCKGDILCARITFRNIGNTINTIRYGYMVKYNNKDNEDVIFELASNLKSDKNTYERGDIVELEIPLLTYNKKDISEDDYIYVWFGDNSSFKWFYRSDSYLGKYEIEKYSEEQRLYKIKEGQRDFEVKRNTNISNMKKILSDISNVGLPQRYLENIDSKLGTVLTTLYPDDQSCLNKNALSRLLAIADMTLERSDYTEEEWKFSQAILQNEIMLCEY